jgi:outer membrane protein assembly factor BamB
MKARLAVVLVLMAAVGGTAFADDGEDLREAARVGDPARVRALLDRGVKADSEGRHGLTALMLAAASGRLDLARLLVEKGASVNARERFFGQTVLAQAARGKQPEMVRWLLENGSTDADGALNFALDTGDLALARRAVASGHLEPLDLLAYRKQAEAKDSKVSAELRAFLATATVARPARVPFTPDPKRLAAYAGRYGGGGGAPEATVTARENGLLIALAGQPEMTVTAVAADLFENAAGDVAVSFFGRAGTIEAMMVNRNGDLTRLGVASAPPQDLPKAEAVTAEKVARGAPRPWPSFRGEGAAGSGDGQGAALSWNLARGEGIRFKTAVPGMGLSSPIVFGRRIFVTTAVSSAGDATFRTGLYGDGDSVNDVSEHSFRLLALDTRTGAIAWDREVHRTKPTVKRHLKSSQSNATPVTDGQRVIVMFGTVGVLAAYDFTGKELWRRDVGVIEASDPQAGAAQWGHASSPILYRDLVIVQADRVKDSYLAAFRAATGEPVWRVARDEPSTWATPNVVAAASGDELVTNGQKVRAYDPLTGRLLWTLGPNSEVIVATPVVADGLALVTAGYPPVRPVYAIRPGQRGDISLAEGQRTSPAIAWSHARGGTYIPTPLPYRGFLYTVNNNGVLTAYRLASGEQVYQTRLPMGSYAASPVAADGRLYFASETGEVHVLRAGPDYQLLTTNVMDEVVMATPAVSDGLLVIRTLKHVVGIAEGERLASR